MGLSAGVSMNKAYESRVTPEVHDVCVTEAAQFPHSSFVDAAQLLGAVSGRYGLVSPGFRSPPRVVGVQRTIRRRPGGGVVAVVIKGRPLAAVLADMIDGVIALNNMAHPESDTVRAALWNQVTPLLQSHHSGVAAPVQRVA
jgi:hypothetical protein